MAEEIRSLNGYTFKDEVARAQNAQFAEDNVEHAADIRMVELKTIDKIVDCIPRTSAAWYQGSPGYLNVLNRISAMDYINISGYDRVYFVFDGEAKCEIYTDVYKGEPGAYEPAGGYGYYKANNYFNVKANGFTAMRFTLKKLGNTNILPAEAASITDNMRVYVWNEEPDVSDDTKIPVKLRLMQYNIGKFNYGISGGLSSNVEEKIANYKKFFGEYQPDILCMQEYPVEEPGDGGEGWIDAGHLYNPDETLFNALYPHSTEMFFEVNIKGNLEPQTTKNVHINIDDATYRTKGTINRYTINGKSVGVLSCWFNVSAPEENRLNQLRDAIAQLATYDAAIICADTNANNQSEFETMLEIIDEAGYIPANGGYFGSFETYNLESSGYKQIDNILVRGAKIKNVICPDVCDKLSSDHYPILADIVIT